MTTDNPLRNPEDCTLTIKHRNLPHWHRDRCIQFVTFHLADSLPASVRVELEELRATFVKANPLPWSEEVSARFNSMFPAAVNDYLDAGYGSCCLRRKDCAAVMSGAIEYFDGERYVIHRYVVMLNHVHVLVELNGSYNLSQICRSWKNFSALQINRIIGSSGRLWHQESWDRMIRNNAHYDNVVGYIEKNIRQGGVVWR